jgi:hypothetical protein
MAAEPQDVTLTAAIALGWRVAELYSVVDDPGVCSQDMLLPAHGSLEPADQIELQLATADGFGTRAGVTSVQLMALKDIARESTLDKRRQSAFRERLRAYHVDIDKDLWGQSEALGRAYELGNGLSDTYGRVCRAYRESQAPQRKVWTEVFSAQRVERLKKLLDDLHSRLDPTAASVVREQLDEWAEAVETRVRSGNVPSKEQVVDGLRRQTVIWRQLVARDKEPDAYLGDTQRAHVRDRLRRLVWRRYSKFLPVLTMILAIAAFGLPPALAWYQDSIVPTGLTSLVVAGIGALGITRASIILTLRSRVQDWAELLWQRALVAEVSKATLTVDEVIDTLPDPTRRERFATATSHVVAKVRPGHAPPRPATEAES